MHKSITNLGKIFDNNNENIKTIESKNFRKSKHQIHP